MAKKRVRVKVKKYRSEMRVKTKKAPIIVGILYMAGISLLLSFMISRCSSPIFVEDQTGHGPRREKEMQVTIFAGSTSYPINAMESLTLRVKDKEYPINAKDVDKGMQVLLDGKFRYVIEVRA